MKVLASAKAWKQKAMLLANQNSSESLETDESTESANAPIVESSNERADLKFLAAAKAWKQKEVTEKDNTSDSQVENQITNSTDHKDTELTNSKNVNE